MAGGQQFQSKPKLTDAFGFISNSERKAQSRLAYRSAYGLTKDGRGSGWMKPSRQPTRAASDLEGLLAGALCA